MDHTIIKNNKAMPQQITIYYNPAKKKHVKTLAHAESIGEVLAMPFEQAPSAYNIWTDIWKHVSEDPLTVFDKQHPKYESLNVATSVDSYEEWHKVLTNNPDLIASPIAVSKEDILVCHRPTEIHKFMSVEAEKI